MSKKLNLLIITGALIAGLGAAYYIWSPKPQPKVETYNVNIDAIKSLKEINTLTWHTEFLTNESGEISENTALQPFEHIDIQKKSKETLKEAIEIINAYINNNSEYFKKKNIINKIASGFKSVPKDLSKKLQKLDEKINKMPSDSNKEFDNYLQELEDIVTKINESIAPKKIDYWVLGHCQLGINGKDIKVDTSKLRSNNYIAITLPKSDILNAKLDSLTTLKNKNIDHSQKEERFSKKVQESLKLLLINDNKYQELLIQSNELAEIAVRQLLPVDTTKIKIEIKTI